MVANNFIDDASQEFFGEIGIDADLRGQLPNPRQLLLLSPFIDGIQLLRLLVPANSIRKTESLREQTHQFFVNAINPSSKNAQIGLRFHVRPLRGSALAVVLVTGATRPAFSFQAFLKYRNQAQRL
jgi:hypothetical protein